MMLANIILVIFDGKKPVSESVTWVLLTKVLFILAIALTVYKIKFR